VAAEATLPRLRVAVTADGPHYGHRPQENASAGVPLGELAPVFASELRKQGGVTVAGPVHLRGTAEDCYRIA
jgi:hypothetical protein